MAHSRVTAEILSSSTLTTHVKDIVHPKIKILSSFTHTHVVPNLSDFLSTAQPSQKKIF